MKYLFKKKIILLLLWCISTNIYSQNEKFEERVLGLLNKIESYEYNQDGTPLYELDRIIKNGMNENKNLEFLEQQLIKSLLSNSTYDAKLFICKQLSFIGTDKSVNPLLSFISDSRYADIVRLALEKIRSDKVDSGLLKIIETVDDEIKKGIITTLGARKSYSSINTISKYVQSENVELSINSAAALGFIGGIESAKIMNFLIDKVNDDVKKVLFDSYLKCGDEFLSLNKIEMASEVYSNVLDKCNFISIKYAALKGLIKSSHNKSGLIILNLLKNDNNELVKVAVSQIELLKTPAEFEKINQSFTTFSPDVQELLLNKISELELKYFIEAARSAVKKGPINVQIAAVKCLGNIGNKNDIPLLTSIALESNYDLNSAGSNALYSLKGKDIDDAIIHNISLVENKSKIVLVKAIGERRIKSGFDILLTTSKSEELHLRIASYESLGIISDTNQLDELLDLFISIENENELKKMENTLAKAALKNDKIDERAEKFLAVLDKTNDFNKEMSLVRILGSTGDKNAYSKIKEYLFNKNPEVKKVAIQSLYNWPNLDPLEDFLEIISTENNETHKTIALRGYINLLKNKQLDYSDNITDKYESVLKYVNDDSEKLMILSGLSELNNLAAANITMKYLNETKVKEEAELALLQILNKVRWRNPNEAYDALEKMLEEPSSENISIEVKTLMNRIRK